MEAFTRVLKIDVKFATPYYKITHGLVEMSNKIMEDLLRPYIRDDAQFWDKKLNCLTFAHNQIPNRTTGFSPATLILGEIYAGSWMQYEKL